MAAQGTKGVILRKYFLRETSYILVLFTREYGKIKGVIKGVRKPYPQFAGNYEIFTECDIVFYKKKKNPLDLITQCEATNCFLTARKDIERLTYANYFIELIDIVANENDQNIDLYDILIKTLGMLTPGISAKRVARIFELKLLKSIGLNPFLDNCILCQEKVSDQVLFSVKEGGIICAKCAPKSPDREKISLGALNFMHKIVESDIEKTARIKVSKEVGQEIESLLKKFIYYYINRPIKSLKFLDQVKQKNILV